MSAKSKPTGRSWFLRHKVLTALAALFLVGAIGSAFDGGDSGGDGTPAALAGPAVTSSTTTSSTTTSSTTTSSTTASSTTASSTTTSVTPTPTRTPTATRTKAKATTQPAPATTTTKAKASTSSTTTKKRTTTTTSSIRTGVHAGAFCSPEGAFGRTSTGKLMECKPSATDSRNRWRAA